MGSHLNLKSQYKKLDINILENKLIFKDLAT